MLMVSFTDLRLDMRQSTSKNPLDYIYTYIYIYTHYYYEFSSIIKTKCEYLHERCVKLPCQLTYVSGKLRNKLPVHEELLCPEVKSVT